MGTRLWLELLLLAAIWGASFLFMRIAAPEFGPLALIALRVAIATVFLLAVLRLRGGLAGLAALRSRLAPLFVVGAFNSALPFTLFAYATLFLSAGFAAVLNASVPLFAAVLAFALWRESLSPARVAGLILGFAGVLLLVWERIGFTGEGGGLAVAAALLASLSYGFGANYSKRHLGDVSPAVLAAGSQAVATVLLAPLALLAWPEAMPSARSWIALLALGIACTGIAYVLFFRLIAEAGPTRAVAVTYLLPLFGMLWGGLVLGEAVSADMLWACAVILFGTALATGSLRWPAFAERKTA